jgi:hypothetical protein
MRRFAILAACAAALTSCGGGGSADVNPATTFRPNVVGDAWNYQVETINFGVFGSYGGTLSEAFSSDTFNGGPSIRFTRSFDLSFPSGPTTISSYEELSPAGVLLAEQDGSGLSNVVSNTFNVPTPLSLSTQASGVLTLADGSSYTITYKIVGKTQMITLAGTFACWIVNQTVTHSDGTVDTYTLWIAPETGNYVRITDTTTNTDGTGYQYTASLTSIVTLDPPVAGATAPARPTPQMQSFPSLRGPSK